MSDDGKVMARFRTSDEMESESIRTVHDDWDRLRGRRRYPGKGDIDPPALPGDGETVDFCLLVEDYRSLNRFEAPLR